MKTSALWILFTLSSCSSLTAVHAFENPLRFLSEALFPKGLSSATEEDMPESLDLGAEQTEGVRSSSSGASLPQNVAEMTPRCSNNLESGRRFIDIDDDDVVRVDNHVTRPAVCCNSCLNDCGCYAWVHDGNANTCTWLRATNYPSESSDETSDFTIGIKSDDSGCGDDNELQHNLGIASSNH